jgi:pyruvate-formate lyase-activating enzyme
MTPPTIADPVRSDSVAGVLSTLLVRAVDGTPKSEFLRLADEAQRELVEVVGRVYDREVFARLLALRLVNLVVARHHFHHRHTRVASRPFQLMVDPVNNCHLACPGCLHTSNPAFEKTFDWPGGAIKPEIFSRFLGENGPLAWGLVLYNWGEPLLHKQTPALIRSAKRQFLHVCLSTNLSVRFDVDALVSSGLNFLFLSIDGATQQGYSRFRRGGDLELVLDNVRRILEARRRLGTGLPFVLWRYLTFEHNLDEVETAMAMAREIGVDQFSVTTPFDVSWDDPEIRAARSPLEGTYLLRPDAVFKGALDEWRTADLDEDEIEREFGRSWLSRLPVSSEPVDEPSRANASTCRWLYQSVTLDARARVLPCCMAPEHGKRKVYGSYPDDADPFNTADVVLSRLAFSDRERFEAEIESRGVSPPYCAVCRENPDLTYTLDRDVQRDLRHHDPAKVVEDDLLRALTSWAISR